jgi:hypothetical protein
MMQAYKPILPNNCIGQPKTDRPINFGQQIYMEPKLQQFGSNNSEIAGSKLAVDGLNFPEGKSDG